MTALTNLPCLERNACFVFRTCALTTRADRPTAILAKCELLDGRVGHNYKYYYDYPHKREIA